MSNSGRRPDILVVLFDDMGYSDLGCYGSAIRTPNIDRLASSGSRFSRFDVTPLCSPTRAALLTGRNPHAVGMGTIVQFASDDPGYSGVIPQSAAMLPMMLKPAGYTSGLFGKWHLSPSVESGPGGPYRHWPLAKGFDRFFGFLAGRVHQFRPELVQDNTFVDTERYGGRHVSELIIDEATTWIADHAYAQPDDPYFAMISFGAVHSPHHAPDEYLQANRGAYAHGWDEERRRRFERQKQLGVIPADTELPASDPSIPEWDSVDGADREVSERLMEAYAGHLEHADAQLGRILSMIRQLGREDDTLVIVMSDNGATNAGGALGTLSEEAVLNDSPRGEPAVDLDKIGGPDYFNQYSAGWGQSSNTPFRRYKHTVHNGGTRSPLVVAGPGVARPGAVDNTTAYVTDIVPTILELAGVAAPAVVAGTEQMPLHGRSLAPQLRSDADAGARQPQYFEVAGHRAMLSGQWKAVTFHRPNTAFDEDRWELYNIERDPAEAKDVAAEHPLVLEQLIEQWWAQAESNQVLPLGSSKGKSALFRDRPDRLLWTFFPNMTPVPQAAAPEISGHDFTTTVQVDAISPSDEGVLMAMGDVFGGVSLYVLDGCLRFSLNALGEVTTVALPAGAHLGARSVKASFRVTEGTQGMLALTCDLAGEPVTAPVVWAPRLRFFMGTAQCGRDQVHSVVDDYVGPFPFAGRIEQASVEVHPRVASDERADALLRELMND